MTNPLHTATVDFALIKNQFDLNQKVSTSAWLALSRHVELVDTVVEQPLLTEGKLPQYVYFLTSGIAREFASRRHGDAVTRAFHQGPTVIADLSAFKRQTPCYSSVSMVTEGAVYRVKCADFVAMVREHQDLEHWYLVVMSHTCVQLQSRLRNLLQMDHHQRLEGFIAQYPELIRRIPTQHIANYLEIPLVIVKIVKRNFTASTESPLSMSA